MVTRTMHATSFISFIIHFAAYSSAPLVLELITVNSTSASMRWLPPYTRNQNTNIRGYRIAIHNREEDTMTAHESHQNLFELRDLHPNYHYTISVRAITNVVGPNATIRMKTQEDGE